MSYDSTLREDDRIVYASRKFEILGIAYFGQINDGYIRVDCAQVNN
jgi:hypothetical protein